MRTTRNLSSGKESESGTRNSSRNSSTGRSKRVTGILNRPASERTPGERRQRVKKEEDEQRPEARPIRLRRSTNERTSERMPARRPGRPGRFTTDSGEGERGYRSARPSQRSSEGRSRSFRRDDNDQSERRPYRSRDERPAEGRPFRSGERTGERKYEGARQGIRRSPGYDNNRPERRRSADAGGTRPAERRTYGERGPGRDDSGPRGRSEDRSGERRPYRRREGNEEGQRPSYSRTGRSSFRSGERGSRFGSGDERNQRRVSRPGYGERDGFFEKLSGRKSYSDQEQYPVESEKKTASTDEIRLNKYISNSGVCSRREADTYITAGVVTINGQVVTELGTKVKPGDEVRFDGRLLNPERKVYLLLNKPKDYVTTTDDPHAEATVMDLVRNACPERIYPVGRLDLNTTGILLLTNDGELSKKLIHPSSNIEKVYQVTLDKPLTKTHLTEIARGIELEDGPIAADAISYVDMEKKEEIGIEIHSGRNRIVRRIFEHLGYRIKKLDRVSFAGLTKKNLPRGKWRFLTPNEVNFLKMK